MTAPYHSLPHASAHRPRASRPKAVSGWNSPKPNSAFMAVMGIVNRIALLRTYFRVQKLIIPPAELAMLRTAVNPRTSAFLGPNHPEFGCDWMIDKELSTLVAPNMASWADRGIVASAPRFWGMNNLIANDGGDEAREYSIESALRGDHVLLHPEGSVRWTSDHVHPLFPGIAQMAMAAAERTERPVYIVPVVWKLRHTGDVSRALHREMKVIEDALGLPRSHSSSVAERFAALQENVLVARMRRFGYEPIATGDFFQRQEAFQRYLMEILETRYDAGDAGSLDRATARFSKQIRVRLVALRGNDTPAAVAERAHLTQDAEIAEEAKRLGEFSRVCYGAPTLTQEQLAESLKRIRDRLVRATLAHKVANMLPRPFGTRVAHVGVPAPIRVQRVPARERAAYERALLDVMRASMQAKLDEINARIEPEVRRVANLL